MAWRERRGYTLRLSQPHGGRDRFARVALIERDALVGRWFNIRESRAEAVAGARMEARSLGRGRVLSWRPLSERDARAMLAARLTTLEALGYSVLDAGDQAREPWEWLRNLAERSVDGEIADEVAESVENDVDGTEVVTEAAASGAARLPAPAADAEPSLLINALAERVGLPSHRFSFPSFEDLGSADIDALGPALARLADGDTGVLRAVAERWLTHPQTAYELDPALVERWFSDGGPACEWLSPRMPHEGLAMLGPHALRRLHQTSASPTVRAHAGLWTDRLFPHQT